MDASPPIAERQDMLMLHTS